VKVQITLEVDDAANLYALYVIAKLLDGNSVIDVDDLESQQFLVVELPTALNRVFVTLLGQTFELQEMRQDDFVPPAGDVKWALTVRYLRELADLVEPLLSNK